MVSEKILKLVRLMDRTDKIFVLFTSGLFTKESLCLMNDKKLTELTEIALEVKGF